MAGPDRQAVLDQLQQSADFDVVIVGGGITGAGIAREAAGSGLKTLLVEQRDFAWGTSSRSSKMVHGGLRYLGSGHYGLARDAVRERQRLLAEAPGLIEPLRFILPHYRKQFPGPRVFGLLLWAYDRLAGQSSQHLLTPAETLQWVPGLTTDKLTGASAFTDAVTDDARLVLRVLDEAVADGAVCVNYLRAAQIHRTDGQVTGVTLTDAAPDRCADDHPIRVNARLIINATGAWADQLRQADTRDDHIRPLRGSHLILPFDVLPVSCCVSLMHPEDRRPVFAFPWLGTTVLGTTDLDHPHDLDEEPAITEPEIHYLLTVASTLFPGCPIHRDQILGSWSGVRPVVSRGDGRSPSKEKREHVIWPDHGLISVAGGKLTTFRLIAREVLEAGTEVLGNFQLRDNERPVFSPGPRLQRPDAISHQQWRRLAGYYGAHLKDLLEAGPLVTIPGTNTLWAEVFWALIHGQVIHLDDLMLRRTRLGMILPNGAAALLPEFKAVCQQALSWDNGRWDDEMNRYLDIWHSAFSLPSLPPASGDQ